MPFARRFDPERQWLWVTASGRISYEDLLQHMQDARTEGVLRYPHFVDGTSATIAFSAADARNFARALAGLSGIESFGPSAVLVSTDVAYGMSRMLQTLLKETVRVRVFRARSEAELWLANAGQGEPED